MKHKRKTPYRKSLVVQTDTGETVPNAIRYQHAELESTLEGSHGYGKVMFGEPTWAHATSKPFGSQFKAKRPEITGRCLLPTVKVENLAHVKPFVPAPVVPVPQDIVVAKESPDGWRARREAQATEAARVGYILDKFRASRIRKKVKVETVAKAPKPKPEYQPGIVGLDVVRESNESNPLPDWELSKLERGELIACQLELRSLFRMMTETCPGIWGLLK